MGTESNSDEKVKNSFRKIAEKIQRLEKEVAYLKEQGISEAEHDIVLEARPKVVTKRDWVVWIYLVILTLAFGWLYFSVENSDKEAGANQQVNQEPFRLP